MKVLLDDEEIADALAALRRRLDAALAARVDVRWSFPGHGTSGEALPTWTDDAPEPFSIAVGAPGAWATRTPVLLALEHAEERVTPVVEINIPLTGGDPARQIAGCFGRDDDGHVWLLHRASSFTAHGARIGKDEAHAFFADQLVEADDGDRHTAVLPVARLDRDDLVARLREFAVQVQALKRTRRGSQQ